MESSTQASARTTLSQLRTVARAPRGCLPSSGDTLLLSQQSFQTSVDDQLQPAPVASSPRLGEASSASQSRKRRGARDIVDEDHLSLLIAAYNVHFENYSEGKTQVTQVIPSLVWKDTYATYVQAFPNSSFKQESLKERLRDTLKELKTGNSNEEMSERAALQSSSVMEALRCTDGHAKRSILRKRAKILDNTQAALQSEDDTSGDSDCVRIGSPRCHRKKLPGEEESSLGKKTQHDDTEDKGKKTKQQEGKENQPAMQTLTKAQMLHKQMSSIERISNTYVNSFVKRDALVDLRIVANEYKHSKNRIDKLKTALEFAVITDDEFKVTANRQLDMWTALQDDILDCAMNYYILPGEEPGPRFCEPIDWDALETYMKQWRALLSTAEVE